MPQNEAPTLVFEYPFDERAQFEAKCRGYLSHAKVRQPDGTMYPVYFYDCTRLAQELQDEVSAGKVYIAELGMIILQEVTLENMNGAIEKLTKVGFFKGLKPL
jgi:hypothetical protein